MNKYEYIVAFLKFLKVLNSDAPRLHYFASHLQRAAASIIENNQFLNRKRGILAPDMPWKFT